MFITENDLYSKIRASDLRQIAGDDTTIIQHAISSSVGLVRSKIDATKYDVQRIFDAAGEQREGLLVSICVDVAIYEIVGIAQPNIDLTDRRERHNQALAYLDEVRDRNLPTGWPLLPEDPNTTPDSAPVVAGGNPPRNNYF